MTASAILLAGVSLVACSTNDVKKGASDVTTTVTETAFRNAVATAGSQAFAAQGEPLQNGLACTIKKQDTQWPVACFGTTTGGSPATLTGHVTTGDRKLLRGSFTGTVAGKTVFQTDCLGARC